MQETKLSSTTVEYITDRFRTKWRQRDQ